MLKLIIRIIIFLYPLLSAAQQKVAIEHGVLDLRSHNFNNNKHIDLVGDWKFYYGELIEPASISKDLSDWIDLKSPGVWNNAKWKGEKLKGKGYGTYYLNIKLPEGSGQFGLKIPTFGTAGKVFVNGEHVMSEGEVGTSPEASKPTYKRTLIHLIPPYENGELEIVVHVSNFHYRKGGLWNVFRIGQWNHMLEKNRKDLLITAFITGAILIMGLFHLTIFITGNKDRYNLYFFFICLLATLRTLVTGEIYIVHLIKNIPWGLVVRLEFISVFFVGKVAILLLKSLYPKEVNEIVFKVIVSISLLASVAVFLIPVEWGSYLIPPFQLIILIQALYFFYVIIAALRRKRVHAGISLFAVLFALASIINDILVVNYVLNTALLAHFGVFIFVVCLSYIGAKRFIRALGRVEDLSNQLSMVNRSLEQKVQKRTLELKERNELINEQNERIRNQNDELKELNAEQSNLMAVVAHDLKAPLNRILGLVNILKLDSKLEASQQELTKQMEFEANSGKKLITDLTALQSFDREIDNSSLEEYYLNEHLIKVCEYYSLQAKEKEIEVICDIPKSKLKILTIKDFLHRIIDNLLSNALKFSQANKKVYLSVRTGDNETWMLKVKDEGPGFSKEDKKLLFRKFQRLSAKPTGGEVSTGLGLSIVKTLTDKLGGQIKLDSTLGSGSEFTITFPIYPSNVVGFPHNDGIDGES